MKRNYAEIKINQLFVVKSGDYHAIEQLDSGNIPLIACGILENGFVGYFDIPIEKTYSGAITVAYNGLPLITKYHPYKFGAKDDVAILIPRRPMKDSSLFYIASLLNMMIWRYSYGRKCYKEKLQNVSLRLPVIKNEEEFLIDENIIEAIFSRPFIDFIPKKTKTNWMNLPSIQWKSFNILEILELRRGDFHSLTDLEPGNYMTVSRVSDNNGVVGNFSRPKNAKVYPAGTITVSTLAGDAFVQVDSFIATDNVIVCKPRKNWQISTLFFIAFMLNRQKWRYSYGRQSYREKLTKVNIELPSKSNGELDEDLIQKIVGQTSYWSIIKEKFN